MNRAYHVGLRHASFMIVLLMARLYRSIGSSARELRRVNCIVAGTGCVAWIKHPRLQPMGKRNMEHTRSPGVPTVRLAQKQYSRAR